MQHDMITFKGTCPLSQSITEEILTFQFLISWNVPRALGVATKMKIVAKRSVHCFCWCLMLTLSKNKTLFIEKRWPSLLHIIKIIKINLNCIIPVADTLYKFKCLRICNHLFILQPFVFSLRKTVWSWTSMFLQTSISNILLLPLALSFQSWFICMVALSSFLLELNLCTTGVTLATKQTLLLWQSITDSVRRKRAVLRWCETYFRTYL